MRTLALLFLLLGLAAAQLLIGGGRLLYAIPADILVAISAVLLLWPARTAGKSASAICLFTTLGLAAYVYGRIHTSPFEYLARMDYFIIFSSVVVYLVTALCFDQPRQRLFILGGLLILAIAHVIVGAIQFKEGNQFMPFPAMQRIDKFWRASGFYISPNHFAGMVEVVALFALSLVVWGNMSGKIKALVAYAGACCLAGLAMSGSRGGYLSIIVGTIAFTGLSLWACRVLYPQRLFVLCVAALVALVALGGVTSTVMFQSETLKKRFTEINDPENMRFLLWESALEQFKLNPTYGTGSGTFLYYGRMFRNPAVQADPIHVHNDYLHLLAEYGVVGAGIFGVFLLAHCASGLRSIRRLAEEARRRFENRSAELALLIGALAAVGAYTLHSVVDFNLHIPANALLMAFAFGIIANPGGEPKPAGAVKKGVVLFSRLAMGAAAVVVIGRGLPLLPGEWFAEQARVALRERKVEDAWELAQRALEHEKKNPNIYFYAADAARVMAVEKRGLVAERQNDSIAMFKRSLELFPMDSRTLLKLAHAYSDFGMFDEAEETLEQAEEIDPNSTLVYSFYGLMHQTKGDLEEAEHYYRLALELDLTRDNKFAQEGYAAVRSALDPIRATIKPIPAEMAEEADEMDEEEEMDEDVPERKPAK